MSGWRRRSTALIGVAVVVVACGNSRDERIAQIERDARQRIAQAQRDADRKIAEAEARLATLADELARKKAELDRALRAESNAFEADRHEFEQQCRATLERLDREAGTLAGKANAGTRAALERIAEQRRVVEHDVADLGAATRESFGELKQKINRELSSLESSIDAARTKPRTPDAHP